MTPHLPPIAGEVYVCESRHPGRRIEAVVGWIGVLAPAVRVVSVALTIRGDPTVPEIGHTPFDEATFAVSCKTRVRAHASISATLQEGYDAWKTARGGFFTLGVDEAIDAALSLTSEEGR